jgi:hypothetical protein
MMQELCIARAEGQRSGAFLQLDVRGEASMALGTLRAWGPAAATRGRAGAAIA